MAKKKSNLQERKLHEWKNENKNVTVFLTTGIKLNGRVKEYDEYTILLGDEKKESLIYKHAISTIV